MTAGERVNKISSNYVVLLHVFVNEYIESILYRIVRTLNFNLNTEHNLVITIDLKTRHNLIQLNLPNGVYSFSTEQSEHFGTCPTQLRSFKSNFWSVPINVTQLKTVLQIQVQFSCLYKLEKLKITIGSHTYTTVLLTGMQTGLTKNPMKPIMRTCGYGDGDFLEHWERKTWKTKILHKCHECLKFDVLTVPVSDVVHVFASLIETLDNPGSRNWIFRSIFVPLLRITQTSSVWDAQRTISKIFVIVNIHGNKMLWPKDVRIVWLDGTGPSRCDLHTRFKSKLLIVPKSPIIIQVVKL